MIGEEVVCRLPCFKDTPPLHCTVCIGSHLSFSHLSTTSFGQSEWTRLGLVFQTIDLHAVEQVTPPKRISSQYASADGFSAQHVVFE
jgi:hypothetical protein